MGEFLRVEHVFATCPVNGVSAPEAAELQRLRALSEQCVQKAHFALMQRAVACLSTTELRLFPATQT